MLQSVRPCIVGNLTTQPTESGIGNVRFRCTWDVWGGGPSRAQGTKQTQLRSSGNFMCVYGPMVRGEGKRVFSVPRLPVAQRSISIPFDRPAVHLPANRRWISRMCTPLYWARLCQDVALCVFLGSLAFVPGGRRGMSEL